MRPLANTWRSLQRSKGPIGRKESRESGGADGEHGRELRGFKVVGLVQHNSAPARYAKYEAEWRDLEPMTGIEPALSAWEAEVLPLNYIGVRHP